MKKSDDATMDAAFAAFWVSAERYAGAAAYASLRQAFKNGAAFPLGRGATRGKAALDRLATQDEARALQEAWPWFVMNAKAHPEWGGSSGCAARRLSHRAHFVEDRRSAGRTNGVVPSGRNHGIVGLTLRTPDDTRSEWRRPVASRS
jgi:hypothetical protein